MKNSQTTHFKLNYINKTIILSLFIFQIISNCASKPNLTNSIALHRSLYSSSNYNAYKSSHSFGKKDSIIKIEITNLPTENFWLDIIKILIATAVGGLIVWSISYRTQRKLLLKENFERNLFALLENQNNILNEIETKVISYIRPSETIHYSKRNFFLFARAFMVHLYQYLIQDNCNLVYLDLLNYDFNRHDDFVRMHKTCFIRKTEKTDSQKQELALFVYNYFFEKYYDAYGHYMRHLYRILLFIENEDNNIKKYGEIKFYTDLVQARMSTSELFLVFYNGLKYPNAKRLVKKYCLIENLLVTLLLDESHRSIYESDKCKMKEV